MKHAMRADPHDLAIALAGLFQAVRLVQQTARGTTRDGKALAACMTGLFNTSPESADSVFGDPAGLALGIETALGQLGAAGPGRDLELSRYAVMSFYLARRLSHHRTMLDAIGSCIEAARGQAGVLGEAHPEVIDQLGVCYQQTISTLRPRIIVNGQPAILSDPNNQRCIRALLLAAIRAAVLWRQCGGGRLTLFLQRRKLLQSLQRLQNEAGRSR